MFSNPPAVIAPADSCTNQEAPPAVCGSAMPACLPLVEQRELVDGNLSRMVASVPPDRSPLLFVGKESKGGGWNRFANPLREEFKKIGLDSIELSDSISLRSPQVTLKVDGKTLPRNSYSFLVAPTESTQLIIHDASVKSPMEGPREQPAANQPGNGLWFVPNQKTSIFKTATTTSASLIVFPFSESAFPGRTAASWSSMLDKQWGIAQAGLPIVVAIWDEKVDLRNKVLQLIPEHEPKTAELVVPCAVKRGTDRRLQPLVVVANGDTFSPNFDANGNQVETASRESQIPVAMLKWLMPRLSLRQTERDIVFLVVPGLSSPGTLAGVLGKLTSHYPDGLGDVIGVPQMLVTPPQTERMRLHYAQWQSKSGPTSGALPDLVGKAKFDKADSLPAGFRAPFALPPKMTLKMIHALPANIKDLPVEFGGSSPEPSSDTNFEGLTDFLILLEDFIFQQANGSI